MKPITRPYSKQQAGFSLLFTLIALVVLLVASVAIMRSSGMSLFSSGNLSFKQDMLSQSERVNVRVYELLRPGGDLAGLTATSNNQVAHNYSASLLAANAQGIPNALLSDANFQDVGTASNDITIEDSHLTMRYVIERLCQTTGRADVLGSEMCVTADQTTGGSRTDGSGGSLRSVVYRVSIRIQGPRGAESFVQSSFSKPI